MFVTFNHFQNNLIFAGKAGSLPFEWNPLWLEFNRLTVGNAQAYYGIEFITAGQACYGQTR